MYKGNMATVVLAFRCTYTALAAATVPLQSSSPSALVLFSTMLYIKKSHKNCETSMHSYKWNGSTYSAVGVVSSVAVVASAGAASTGVATASTFLTTGTLRLSIRAFLSAP